MIFNTINGGGNGNDACGNLGDFCVGMVHGDVATEIPSRTFAGSSNAMGFTPSSYNRAILSYINYPNVTSVGSYAFTQCSNLQKVHLPNVVTLEPYAFNGCIKINVLEMPNLQTATANAIDFDTGNIEELMFPKLSLSIGGLLKSETHPKLKKIALGVTTANIPYSTSHSTFFPALEYVEFPNAISVPSSAFRNLYALKSAIIPHVSTSIGSYAFGSCSVLANVDLRYTSAVPTLGNAAFSGTAIALGSGSIYVPSSLYNAFQTATNWTSVSARMVSV